jgi:hypothetical protein
MENTLHQNGSTLVVTKSAILQLSAGDYIEIMWATDSTSGYLEAVAATSFAPATLCDYINGKITWVGV